MVFVAIEVLGLLVLDENDALLVGLDHGTKWLNARGVCIPGCGYLWLRVRREKERGRGRREETNRHLLWMTRPRRVRESASKPTDDLYIT